MVNQLTTSATPGIAFICDRDGRIVRLVRDELDLDGQQLIGQPLTALVDDGSRDKALNFLDQLREEEALFDWQLNVPVQGSLHTLHFAGGEVDGRFLVVAALNSTGMMTMYEEMVRIGNEQANALRTALKSQAAEMRRIRQRDSDLFDEISRLNNELNVMQRELAKKNAELERLNTLKNQFLGMAAHDLRNPLNAIQGYAEFLEGGFDKLEPAQRQEFLQIILDSSRFMASLVEDLLDVARIESGHLDLALAPGDLVALAQKNVQVNSALAAAKEIELTLEYEPLPPVMVDANKIEQVFNNLISNCLKYSHPGSHVWVRLSQPAPRQIQIAVADEGQGIPPDQMERLFRPFTTTTVRTTDGEKSSGLGLVIVRRIVEGHGGTIDVKSEVGQGTTFFVTLPVEPAGDQR